MERELQGAISGQKHYQGLYESLCSEYERLWSEMVASAPASNASLSRHSSMDMSEWPLEWMQGEDGDGVVPVGAPHDLSVTGSMMLEDVTENG